MSFLVLIMELKFYSKIKNKVDTTFNSTTVISYINNKIRNYNGNDISIINGEESDVIKLIDREGNYITYIYTNEGYLCEEIAYMTENMDKSKGQRIFPLDRFSIKKEKKILELTVYLENKSTKGCFYIN